MIAPARHERDIRTLDVGRDMGDVGREVGRDMGDVGRDVGEVRMGCGRHMGEAWVGYVPRDGRGMG